MAAAAGRGKAHTGAAGSVGTVGGVTVHGGGGGAAATVVGAESWLAVDGPRNIYIYI